MAKNANKLNVNIIGNLFVNVNVICLPIEHQEFSRTRLRCPCIPGSNWNLEMLVFEERGKPEYSEKNLSAQSREPTTNSTHIGRRVRATLVGSERSHNCAISPKEDMKKLMTIAVI